MRRLRRSALTASLASVLLGVLAVAPAHAEDTPLKVSEVDALSMGRTTVAPGKNVVHFFTIKSGFTKERTVWMRVGGMCVADGGSSHTWTNSLTQIKVPPPATSGWVSDRKYVRTVAATVTVPQKCRDAHAKRKSTGPVIWSRVAFYGTKPSTAGAWSKGRSSEVLVGKASTAANLKHNLRLVDSPIGKESDYAVHREFPAAHAKKFDAVGINVNDPRFSEWWCDRPGHPNRWSKQKKAYVAVWTKWFKDNPKPSRDQVFKKMRRVHFDWSPRYNCR